MALSTTQQHDLYKLAVGMYSASPGSVYMNALANVINSGVSISALYDILANDPSFTSLDFDFSAASTNQQFATQFVENLVGTSATQANKELGVTILTGLLEGGSTRGAVMQLAIDFIDTVDAADPDWGDAHDRFANRITVAINYTEVVNGSATDLTTLQGTISTVTDDPATIQPAIDANSNATYALTAGATSVDEGGTATFTLATTNVADGTQLAYTLSGVSAADVTGALTGTATVSNGTATISVATVADFVTEGAETLKVALDNGKASATTTVNDTSLTPVFSLAGPASVNEGADATFTLTADTTLADGTAVDYTVSGVSAEDVTGALTGTATFSGGTATITVALAADQTTEGAETLTVTASNASASTTVNDTSITPVLVADDVSGTIVSGQGTAIMTPADIAAFANNDSDSTGAVPTGAVTVDLTSEVGGELVTLQNGNTMFVADAGVRQGSFKYSIDGITQQGTVNVTLNSAPVIATTTLAATEDVAASGDAGATDADSDTLTYTYSAQNGTVTDDGNGAFTYLGNTNFNGTDTLTVTVADSFTTVTQDIVVTVAAVNDDPQVLTPAPAAVDVNAGDTVTVDLATYATDPDTDAVVTFAADAATANGGVVTVAGSTATITYAEGGGTAALGADSFGFTVTDGISAAVPATVTLNVTNTAPVATDFALTAKTGVTQTVDLTGKVSDAEDNTLTPVVTVGSVSSGGSAEVLNGAIVYTSTIGFVGTETVKYTVTDGFGGTSNEATITFTVASNTGGTSGNDLLYGSTAAEAIDGLAGNDTINGGGGLDTITGGDGNDLITFSDGAFQILGANGIDTLVVNSDAVAATFDLSLTTNQNTDAQSKNSIPQAVILRGFENMDATKASNAITLTHDNASTTSIVTGALNDNLTLDISTGTVTVSTLEGNDTVNASGNASTTGKYSIDGGAGNDILTGDGQADTILGGADNDSITGFGGADSLDGGDGNDTVIGGAANDTLLGSAGDDSLVSGAGNDSIDGGTGNDTIDMAGNWTNADTIAGGDGTGDTLVRSGAAVVDADFTKNITGIEGITIASAHNITVGPIASAEGITTISTGNNANTVLLDTGFTNSATVNLGSAANTVTNTANVTLTVKADAANITAADVLTGGTGTDTLSLRADNGTATLSGMTLFENITVRVGSTVTNDISITLGADAVIAANKTLTTDASALTDADATLTYDGSAITTATKVQNVTGGAGNDTITGGAGNDIVDGGGGNDQITGGAGIDNLSGGAGNDVFVVGTVAHFTGLASAETVAGGEGTDTLRFNVTGAAPGAADLAKISSIEVIDATAVATLSVTLTDAVYTANGATTLTVDGNLLTKLTVDAGALTSANSVTAVLSTFDGNTDSVLGGAGNDTFSISGNAIQSDADTITGGSGTDTISINNTAAVSAAFTTAVVTGIENITVAKDTAAVGITTADVLLTGAGTVTVSAAAMTSGTFALTFDGSGETGATSLFNITGGAGNDVLTGGSGNDIISGAAGKDTITGGANIDNLSGGDGNDTFTVGTAAHFTGLSAAETVSGGAGTDTLSFSLGANNLSVGSADLLGLSSIETISITNANAQTAAIVLTDAVFTANGVTSLAVKNIGTATTDDGISVNASALSAANSIAFTGATFVTSGANESVLGGAGNDSFTFSTATDATALDVNDTLSGGTGTDTLTVSLVTNSLTAVTLTNVSGIEAITVSNVSPDTTALTAGITLADANFATVTGAAITASGMFGALTFSAAAEDDSTFNIIGGPAGDTITGGALNDTIDGGTGADSIVGGAGVDSLTGGSGADTLDGGSGIDVMQGGAGNDTYTLDNVNEAVSDDGGDTGDTMTINFTGVGGALIVDLSSSTDQITLMNGLANSAVQLGFENINAALYTNSAGADITGSSGANAITGTSQTDVINPGEGADTVTGGAGADSITLTETTSTIDTVVQADGASTVSTANTTTGVIAAAQTITFANSLDIIYGFVAGTDVLDVGTAGAAVTGIALNEAAFTATKTIFLSGSWSSSTGVFTIAADGAGADTLLLDTTVAADQNIATADTWILLVGVDSDNLVAGTFV